MALLLRRGPLAEALRAAGMDNESTCPLVPLSFPCSSPSSDAGDDDDRSAASRTPSSGEEGDATAVAEREGRDALATQHVIQALSSDLSSMPPAQLADLIRQTSGGWLWCAKYCTAGALLHKRGESESVAALLKGLELLCSERVEAADLSPSVSSAFRGALAKCSVVGTFLFVMLRLSSRSGLRRALWWMAAAALCVRVLLDRLRQAVDRWIHRCLRPNHVYRQLLIVVLTQLTRYIALNHKFGAMVFPPLPEAAGRSSSRAQQCRPSCPSFSQQVSCILSQQHLVDTDDASGVDLDRVLCCVMKDACDTSLHALRIEGLWRRCGWGSIDGLRAWYTLGSIYLVRGAITMSPLPQRDIRLIDALVPVVQDALLDAAVDHLAESSSRCETASENTGNHSLAHVRVLLLQRILANIQETLSSPTLSADGRLRTEQQEDDGPNDGVPNQGCMPQHYDAVRWNLLRACRVWFEPSCLGAATQSPRASQLPVSKAAAPDEPDDDDLSGGLLLAQPCPGRHEREELQADGLDAPLKPVVARNIDAGMVRLPQLPKHIQAQRSAHAALELFE